MKKKLISILVIATLALFSPPLIHAQDLNDSDDPSAPGGPENPDVPIDGGLSILLAAGVAYGAKKGYDKRKKKAADQDEDSAEK